MPHPDPTAEQIDAELADHLAASAAELSRRGIGRAEAAVQARDKFGDVEAVRRQCYWIQQGDTIMFRRVMIALVVLLCLGLIATTASSWLAQSRMTEQLDQLNEQLASLTKTQESLQNQQKPLSITGLIYDGDKRKPVALEEVGIVRLSDTEIVRRVATDRDGHFDSGTLPPDDYFIFSEPRPREKRTPRIRYVQSAPILLYPGNGERSVELNVRYQPTARLEITCDPPLEEYEVENRYRIVPYLAVAVHSERWKTYSWKTNQRPVTKWPVFISGDVVTPVEFQGVWFGQETLKEFLSANELKTQLNTNAPEWALPAGEVWVAGRVVADVVPIGDSQDVNQPGVNPKAKRLYDEVLAGSWLSTIEGGAKRIRDRQFPIVYLSLGAHMQRLSSAREPAVFKVEENGVLKLKAAIPADLKDRVRAVVDTKTTANTFIDAIHKGELSFAAQFSEVSVSP